MWKMSLYPIIELTSFRLIQFWIIPPSYGMTGRRLFNKIVRDWREASDNDRVCERKRMVKNSKALTGPCS